ncbi:MAG: hypothetical protein RL731_1130 [Bacteroidota bacterium]
MFKNLLKVTILLSIGCQPSAAQINIDSIIKQYPFIKSDLSKIEFPENLNSFGAALMQLQLKHKEKVNILHIGDSHVQAGFFSESIMTEFQSNFGNAGRGMVFPYQAAGTNGPSDYAFTSAEKWIGKRNATQKNNLPTGLTGHTIYSKSITAKLEFRQKDTLKNQTINKITVFHASIKDSNFVYQIKLREVNAPVLRNDSASSDMISVFYLPVGVRHFSVEHQINSSGFSSTIYGLYLESSSPGIILNSVGVNGAEYKHYLRSSYFFNQLSQLKPSLIIVSLGTNEAFHFSRFDPNEFNNTLDSFFSVLKSQHPEADVIITSAPAVQHKARIARGKSRFQENKNISLINSILKAQAQKYQCGYWDFYEVMGGKNSMRLWSNAGLTDARRIHFSKKGYLMQGKLLNNAIEKVISE